MSTPPTPEPDPSQTTGFMHRLTTRRGVLFLAGISLLLVLVSAGAAIYYFSTRPAPPGLVNPPTSLKELAGQFPQIRQILEDDKLDSVYKQFMVAYQQGGPDAAYELAQKRGILGPNNDVRMTLELSTTETAELEASLRSHGIVVTATSGNLMDITIPLDVLQASLESDQPGMVFMDISGLDQIVRIRLPIQAIEDVGSVETEGTAVIGADAWLAAGITGKGVKIGVLDVGFDSYKDLLGSDLPANVVAQSFIHGLEIDETGSVHGAAVAEIIHDIAPDAELYFADYQTTAEKQLAVDWLMQQQVDIISSSTGSIFGRRDGTGPLAKMVDDVYAQGVLWINSSGNTGYTHYRGVFTDEDGDGYHEFAPGDEYMGFSPIGGASLSLNWDDWDELRQDYDMYVLDADGNEIASATDAQDGPGSDAGEFLYYEFPDEGPYYMMIYAANADRAVTFDFFLRDGQIEYYTPEYSVNTPGDSNGGVTVGATNWESGGLEDYSSRGPTEDGRIKPDIVAPSGVSSAAYGESWDGTSASCPHVTGAAALLMQAFPDYTAQQIREYLMSHAVDLEESGPDSKTGFGGLFLGDPPQVGALPPAPEPAVPTPGPAPTEVQVLEPTTASLPTATPQLEKEPSGSGDSDSSLTVLLVGCIVLPGMLGLGGIGLLAAVLISRRPRRGAEPVMMAPLPQDRRDWGIPDRPAPSPWQAPPPISPGAPPATPGGLVCSNCGKVNQPGTHFCTNCGNDLSQDRPERDAEPLFCRHCGNPLRANAKFCSNCGNPVSNSG